MKKYEKRGLGCWAAWASPAGWLRRSQLKKYEKSMKKYENIYEKTYEKNLHVPRGVQINMKKM
jgi:hypothetical protein